ncbi:MAG: HTTM domain-containing protein [Planctomycetota bacterium]
MVSNAPLVVFRILFGLIMVAESFGAIALGWVGRVFVEPRLTFPHIGFEWLRFLSGPKMYAYFAAMGACALGAALGWRYRLTSTGLAVLWTGAYFAQKTHYNNHYYLAVLVCWAMALLPAHRRSSLDVRAGRVERTETCAAWIPFFFRLQLAIVFIYAAIAKLYPDWFNGNYLGTNLGRKADRWLIGPLLAEPWFQSVVAYTAVFFDALVIPALWWKKTRVAAYIGLIGFNLFNSYVFLIGVFPYMVLAFGVFFFEASTVERLFRWIPGLTSGGSTPEARPTAASTATPALTRFALVAYFAVQILLPLRHHLIDSDVTWTEEGHRMAWRMMLRTKSGTILLAAHDPASGTKEIIPLADWVTSRQLSRVATRPEFLYQLVQVLRDDYAEQGMPDVEIRAFHSAVSLNGTKAAPLIDSGVDLARVRWNWFGHDDWVLDRAES